jgi:hypothetical protein
MSQPLPPEICVVTTPTGVRYVLPWRPVLPGARRRIRIALGVAALAWAVALYQFVQPPPLPHGKGGGRPPFGFLGLAAGGVALAYAAARRFAHCTAEVGPGGLVLGEWLGPFPQRRQRSLDRIRAVAVHPLPGTAEEVGAVTAPSGGVIEVACEGIQPVWWAHGYPRVLLTPLAAELAARCRVPCHKPDRTPVDPPAVPAFAEQAVPDSDTADVAEKPADSRAVLDRSPDRLTLTLPPVAARGSGKAVLTFLLAGFWMHWPVMVALMGASVVLTHGPRPAGVWLFIAGMLAIGPVVVLYVYHSTGSQTTLTVERGRLTRLKTSPVFGPERHSWRRDEVFALRTNTARGGKGPPTGAVILYPAAGEPVALVESTAQAEMGWIATLLRRELGVPAVPGLPVAPPPAAPASPSGPESAAPAPAVSRSRPCLPPQIRVRTTATGTCYLLPWRRLEWLGCFVLLLMALVPLAGLGAGLCLMSGFLLPDWVRGAGALRGIGGVVLVGFGGLLVFAILNCLVQRSSVEVGPGELLFRQRMGTMAFDHSWPVAQVRRLVTRPLGAGCGTPEAVGVTEVAAESLVEVKYVLERTPEAAGVMEVVGDGEACFRFGMGYPVSLLRPLAQALAERLQVPEEVGDVVADSLVVAPSVPTAPAVAAEGAPDQDVADESVQPAGSRAVLEQAQDGLTVTLPPAGCRRDRGARVGLPFAVAAGVFAALNGLAAVRVAVVGPADAGTVAGVAAWLLGSAAVAAVLALWVFHRARLQTILLVHEKGLAVVRSSPLLRPRRREWPRGEMMALRLGPASPAPHGGKGFALRLRLKDGGTVNVLTGDDEAELGWLAAVLRQALGLPVVPA